ncbi:tRNA (adenosine(37)-N6)-dimethylallyltransferase MiaA [Allorhodopirellula solitaria]|uniref:tRNA dimethylallyltransferase n=1 Tax=Allorhodopirellula solitaria TaxID=2527987 RepID=A0A5C5YJX5_9BACT|nr:tRNA (adenosine(37)-N6)-dimethylallyltransferase MiaA [Allorhodopirellula solitaria]TWT75152.1 IPP transferase [Allorhodopirellula solitaria]
MTPRPSTSPDKNACFPPLLDRALVLTGPTASGKTALAVRVAQAMQDLPVNPVLANGETPPQIEIISLDSIAVYRRMNIGTAKPSAEEQQSVAHHLIDVVEPDQETSVAEYLATAHELVDQIHARGNRPMFVGGTPMYLKGILRGFDPGPPADEAFRAAVMEDVQRHGAAALHQRLEQVDPLSASRIQSHDVRRMIRALEFARQTGTPISHRQQQFDVERRPDEGLAFVLQTPRHVLHRRIASRVEEMFASGLVDEIRALVADYPALSRTAGTAVGYREVLQSDEFRQWLAEPQTKPDWSAVAEQVLFHTRRLARRQETWFRSMGELRGIATHCEDEENRRPSETLVQEMVGAIKSHSVWTHTAR